MRQDECGSKLNANYMGTMFPYNEIKYNWLNKDRFKKLQFKTEKNNFLI